MALNVYLAEKKKFRDQLRVLKQAGKSAEEVWREHRAGILKNARELNWRDSETACALAEFKEAMEIVWGTAVMRKADKAVRGMY